MKRWPHGLTRSRAYYACCSANVQPGYINGNTYYDFTKSQDASDRCADASMTIVGPTTATTAPLYLQLNLNRTVNDIAMVRIKGRCEAATEQAE